MAAHDDCLEWCVQCCFLFYLGVFRVGMLMVYSQPHTALSGSCEWLHTVRPTVVWSGAYGTVLFSFLSGCLSCVGVEGVQSGAFRTVQVSVAVCLSAGLLMLWGIFFQVVPVSTWAACTAG